MTSLRLLGMRCELAYSRLFCLALLSIIWGCSNSEQKVAEMIRQSTLSQISKIKAGQSRGLHDPAPSLIEEIVGVPACANNVESLTFSDFGPSLSDERFEELNGLPRLGTIFFYCTSGTDVFVSRIAGSSAIESLETELADLSDTGMKHVASLPNLKKLVLYGGRPSVGNAGLAELEGHKKLEALSLINTSVSDQGLSVLATLPELKTLVLFWEDFRGQRLTNASIEHLRHLAQLEALELSGGWASEGMIERLRSHLPNCEITSTGVH